TSAAISTRASFVVSRPVISQSIQTIRSCLDSWWGVGAGVGSVVGSGIVRLYRRPPGSPRRPPSLSPLPTLSAPTVRPSDCDPHSEAEAQGQDEIRGATCPSNWRGGGRCVTPRDGGPGTR